jgi:DNA-binding SARP family transcriptional activator
LEQCSFRGTASRWQFDSRDALLVYRGPFLPALGEKSWVTLMRERLRELFARTVARLSDRSRHEGQLEGAITWLDRGLQLDPQAEALYVPLISTRLR